MGTERGMGNLRVATPLVGKKSPSTPAAICSNILNRKVNRPNFVQISLGYLQLLRVQKDSGYVMSRGR